VAGLGRATGVRKISTAPDREIDRIKEIVMAKVIEFYIPTNFRNPRKWVPQLQLGKVIDFCSLAKKSA